MSLQDRVTALKTGFAPTFWVANSLELFERLAFYGMKAVLTVFLANKVGLKEEAGTLAGIFSGVIYSLPIVAGVIVDRYGFRKTLMACFAIFCVGYFLIGMAGMAWSQEIVSAVGVKPYTITVLMLTAVGGSLIKPCIVGTVATTSKEETRALGFSIYYSLVNFGGAIGPMVALLVRQDLGIEFVLVMSSFTSLLLFIGTYFFFKEPEAVRSEQRTFGKVFTDMLLVFRNFKFIGFLIIFSGFWIMFWQIFYLLPFYATDVLHFEQFEILETVDAWCIIFFSLIMASLFKKWKPFTAMTVGFIFASLSWIVIGVFGTLTAVVLGVALFAIGESTQAPRFYEYVSTLAPKDQVGTYMGFAFLPVAIGSFGAGPVADWLRLSYLQQNPSMMWYILAAIGFLSTLLMILYNFFLVKKEA
ncbi:MAG: MFS transporter [Cyclobacteriaceae bacterium]|nr:MFS transporter [Cyclobacteriaceae bacterium]